MTKKKNPHRGSTLDALLEEEGVLDEFRAAAIKKVLAWQQQQEPAREGGGRRARRRSG